MAKGCEGWCWPVYGYIIIAFIGILLNFLRNPWLDFDNILNIGLQVLFAAIWTWLLYFLCKTCHPNWSAFLFLAPFLLGVFTLFLLPVGLDLLTGRRLRLGQRLGNVLQSTQDTLERQMQQPNGYQPAQELREDIDRIRYGGPVGVDDITGPASGVLRTGGFNADPAGVRAY